MCMLRCSCSELAGMSVSWQDHSINFKLDGSDSATCWLQKNIESMRKLSLNISGDVPQTALQDVMEAGRNLTCLSISSKNINELPPLPTKLEQLKLESCSALLTLPVLLQTLRELNCQSCDALEVLPSSLSSTAVCKLTCGNCPLLKSLPQLPPSLVELEMKWCGSLLQLQALPEGLKCLYTADCEALEELPELPAYLTHLKCSYCGSLGQLPQLAHTGIIQLDCTNCSLLEKLPDMPDSLVTLEADFLGDLTRLPRLPTDTLKQLRISKAAIHQLPGSLPSLEVLSCCNTLIQQLPALASCRSLYVDGCEQLQQLPKQLPGSLDVLNCSGCRALQQLPQQLPAGLTHLDCSGCRALQQLPEQLPPALERLWISCGTALKQLPELPTALKDFRWHGCSSLQQLPDLSKCCL